MFPYRKPTAYITLPCATALACDEKTKNTKHLLIKQVEHIGVTQCSRENLSQLDGEIIFTLLAKQVRIHCPCSVQ